MKKNCSNDLNTGNKTIQITKTIYYLGCQLRSFKTTDNQINPNYWLIGKKNLTRYDSMV